MTQLSFFKITSVLSVLLFSASVAVGGTASFDAPLFNAGIQYKYYAGANDTPDASAYQMNLGLDINKNVSADIRTEYQDYNESSFTANRLEIGVTPTVAIPANPQFSIFGRLALGNQWMNTGFVGDEELSFGYGSIEPGLKYSPWVNNSTHVSLSYRYRGSFEDQPFYDTNAVLLGGEYSIDRNNSIVGGYEYVSSSDESDIASNVISVGYLARF